MVGNILSNAGLFSQGMRNAEMDSQRVAQMKQQTATGAIGLEDLTRTNQAQESQREATRSSQSLHELAIAQAEAAKQAGDSESFQKYAQEAMQIPARNADQVAEAALSGANAEQIEAIVERNLGANTGFDKGSLRITTDPTNGHVILNTTKNGQPLPPRDVTNYYAKKQKPVAVGKDQTLVNPASKEVVYSNVQPEAAATGLGDIYMKTGPEAGTTKSKGGPRRTISTTRTEGGAQAQKDLPMFRAVSKAISGNPGMATFDAYGNEILTPEGNIKAALANQVAQTNRNLDPATVANIAVNGEPVVNQRTGERAIKYKGKYYRYAEGTQAQPQESSTVRETVSGVEYPEDQEGGATGNFARGGKVNHKGMC